MNYGSYMGRPPAPTGEAPTSGLSLYQWIAGKPQDPFTDLISFDL